MDFQKVIKVGILWWKERMENIFVNDEDRTLGAGQGEVPKDPWAQLYWWDLSEPNDDVADLP